LKRSSLYSLAAVAFLAVFREGAETILLFQALRTQAGEHARQLGYGLAIGGVVLVGVYLAIRYLSVRLPIRPFFLGTSVLLAILAVSFAGSGVGELQEAGVVPLTQTPWPPAVDLLGIKPTFETLAAQVAILAVIVGLAIWSVSRTRRRAAQARAADAAPPSPEEGNATSPAPEDELNNPPSGSPGESGDQPVDQPVLDQGAGRDAAEAAPTPALIGADQVTKAREGAHQIEGVENPS
ncbi:MAG: FTR1 family protein, partial [Bifidobacteriaceae bacterium]|nr:FTR1 family protein [Bifidobacteriaceae bacterium]